MHVIDLQRAVEKLLADFERENSVVITEVEMGAPYGGTLSELANPNLRAVRIKHTAPCGEGWANSGH